MKFLSITQRLSLIVGLLALSKRRRGSRRRLSPWTARSRAMGESGNRLTTDAGERYRLGLHRSRLVIRHVG
jgi:hypothetical protein